MIVYNPVIYLMQAKRSNIDPVPTCQVIATSLSVIPPVIPTFTKACTHQVSFSQKNHFVTYNYTFEAAV
jgi:hypothetical protein